MQMTLTPEELELVALIGIGLADAYPSGRFKVDARPIKPSPRGWIEIIIEERSANTPHMRLIREPVARQRVTYPRLAILTESILFSVRQQVDQRALSGLQTEHLVTAARD